MAVSYDSAKNSSKSASISSDCQRFIKYPTTTDLLEDLGGYAIALWTVASLIVIMLLCLLIRTTAYVNKTAPKRWRRKIVWINAIYPFTCLMCLCSLIVPASSSLLSDVGVIFISNGSSKFVDLCLMYFGGESRLLLAVGSIDVPLAGRPLCCCCKPCCPRRTMSKRYLKMMKILVQQLPFTQCAYCLMYTYLFIANVTSPGRIAFDDAYLYLTVFNIGSCLSAMYGLLMFLQVTKGNLAHYHYRAKSLVMKLTIIVVKLQDIIFNITIHYGGVAGTGHMSPEVHGAYIRDVVVLLEMFVLGLAAHHLYTQPQQYEHAADEAKKRPAPLDSETESDDETNAAIGPVPGSEYSRMKGVDAERQTHRHPQNSAASYGEDN